MASFDSTTFNYNADGIRISKTYNNITTHFYLDGTKILAQDNGNLLTFKYGVDGVIGFTYEGVGEYFYKKNIFGDIIGILNSSGDEIAKYTYDAWGYHKTLVLNNNEYVDILSTISYTTEGSNNKFIAELNPFRYRGYYYDIETGLYYLNSRYYDPEIGRFINADDINYLDQNAINGLNLYAYCGNNPVINIDPNGNFFFIALILGITALGGAIIKGIDSYSQGNRGWSLISDIFLGAAMGIAVGGAFLAMSGVIVGAIASIEATIFGLSALQTFAIGALVFDIVAFIVAPIYKIRMEGIEFEIPASNILKDIKNKIDNEYINKYYDLVNGDKNNVRVFWKDIQFMPKIYIK